MSILVVHKRPGFMADVVQTDSSLEAFQALLDGGTLTGIELTSDILGYADDNGIAKELPVNFYLHGEPILGPVFFSKLDQEGEDVGFETETEALAVCRALNDARIEVPLKPT